MVEPYPPLVVVVIFLLDLAIDEGMVLVLAQQIKDNGMGAHIAEKALGLALDDLQCRFLQNDPQNFFSDLLILGHFLEKDIVDDIQFGDDGFLFFIGLHIRSFQLQNNKIVSVLLIVYHRPWLMKR